MPADDSVFVSRANSSMTYFFFLRLLALPLPPSLVPRPAAEPAVVRSPPAARIALLVWRVGAAVKGSSGQGCLEYRARNSDRMAT